jgi:wobble nucleotide-excising tRNase
MYKKSETIVQIALNGVPEFEVLVGKLTQSFAINGKAKSTLNNYLRCLAHIETTIVYLQVSNSGSSVKFSPLDTLFTN